MRDSINLESSNGILENDFDIQSLCSKSARLLAQSRQMAARNIDQIQIMTYFILGSWIVEVEQKGQKRSKYGKQVLRRLSEALTGQFGKGFSVDTLEKMRRFYLTYQDRISAPMVRKFADTISAPPARISEAFPFQLSWTHYLILMRIANPDERSFYEHEAISQGWSKRELERQYGSSLYERLLLSSDKDRVMAMAQRGQIIEKPKDIIKDPYVLEFLGLREESAYSESDLETKIINHLQEFMLELGKGFAFMGRQVRFSFDEQHFRVDLVFYNRLLKCFVLIDLKIGELKHQDLGQMQMYVNYYDRYEKRDDENPTIGILLCQKKSDMLVELTLPKDSNIYAAQYALYLPDKQLLQAKLREWIEEETGGGAD